MTKRDDAPGSPDLTPQGNAPSWVDEVLGSSAAASAQPPRPPRPAAPSGPDLSRPDLTKRDAAPDPAPRPPLDGPENLRIPEPGRPARPDDFSSDDWVARITGGQARSAGTAPAGRPYAEAEPPRTDWAQEAPRGSWNTPARPVPSAGMGGFAGGDVAQKKLIAGLLAIFLGSLGVHKFYLGMNRPGALVLGLNVGAWVLAILLGIVTLAVGFIVTLPLASLLSFALGVLGLVEGIIYLTKTDEAFGREYLIGKKAWL